MTMANMDSHKLVQVWNTVYSHFVPDGKIGLLTKDTVFFIAGGFLLDMYLGRPWKDIDVFTTAPWPWEHGMVSENDEEYTRVNSQKFVGQYSKVLDGDEYNFIHFEHGYAQFTPKSLITNFDFSNCQIAFDGDSLEMMPEFISDCANKVLREISTIDGSRETRLARMQAKFPDWKFIKSVEFNVEDLYGERI